MSWIHYFLTAEEFEVLDNDDLIRDKGLFIEFEEDSDNQNSDSFLDSTLGKYTFC